MDDNREFFKSDEYAGLDDSPISAVDITDDFMFSYVMRNPEICIELLQYLLPDRKIRDIKYLHVGEGDDESSTRVMPETQKVLSGAADKRGVRLDAYLDDGKTVYNIEMQTSEDRAIAQRARLYQAHIDINQLDRGQNYDQLKPCYVIFICKTDPFKMGLYRYSFENTCRESPTLRLDDRAYKLFFNTDGTKGDISDGLKELLMYMNDTRAYPVEQAQTDLIRKIERAVVIAKKDEDWRRAYMTYQIHMREAELRGQEIGKQIGEEIGKEIGKEIGQKIGKEIGQKEKQNEIARKMLMADMPVDMVSNITGLSLSEVVMLERECTKGK